ncbi:MAG TPA: hypothetical protein VLE96_05615 [Chlamydiales bacterium]|nr:hypothetical protein [Chlamydiales bacterium]
MKTVLTSQQLMYYRRQGHVRFENFPLDFQKITNLIKKNPRDLFRKEPFLKKIILQQLGPIALELTKSNALHLACDQWFDSPPLSCPMKNLFCFQNLACIFVFSSNNSETILDVFEPSSLSSRIPPDAYLVVFAKENGVLVENQNDPFTVQTRNLGYVYGDRLKNELHPIVRPN